MLKRRTITIANTRRHVKTSLGVSKASYSDDIPPELCLSRYLNRPKAAHPKHYPPDSIKISQYHATATTNPQPPKGSRNNIERAVRIKREVQGKADVSSLQAMTSSTLLEVHSKLYNDTQLPSVCGKEHGIKKNRDAYVDNLDTWTGSLANGNNVADEVMYQLMN